MLPILLVDDDRDSCDSMAKCLAAFGYEAEVAYDGWTALKLLEHKQFGLTISDYQMPGMNGIDLFRRMRDLRPDLPGVLLTGFTTIDVVAPAIEAGMQHVLSKPADFRELIPIIEEDLNRVMKLER